MTSFTRFLSRRGAIYTIMLASIGVLVAINFWGWFFVRSFQERILEQLQQQLQQVVPLYARQISDEFFAEGETSLNTLDWREPLLQSRLFEIKSQIDAQNIFLVSIDRQQFFTDNLRTSSQTTFSNLPLNDSLFTLATLGISPKPELLTFANEYFLTAYATVSDGFGEPVAVLILEAPAQLFSTVTFIRQALIYSGIAGLAIILLFATIIIVAIRRLFRTEAELNAQTSLAQLGQMAAMVAHEIRNPLSIIKGSADVLKKKYSAAEDELFDFIPSEIDRLNRLVSDFLQFARRKELQTSAADANQELATIVKQIDDPRISFRPCATDRLVLIDSDALRQVMLNVIDNARAAILPDGLIYVESEDKKLFVIRIRDDGAGMNEETLAKIFDPFYTTRATGSGLGMAITHRLIQQMKGQVVVDSKEGEGTTVTIKLPFAEAQLNRKAT